MATPLTILRGFPLTHMVAEKLPANPALQQIATEDGFRQFVMSVTQLSFDIRAPVAQNSNKRDRFLSELFGANHACI
jgi:hypothetical protein